MSKRNKEEKRVILEVFRGDFLSKKENQKQLPFFLFVGFLIVLNISLYYNAEQLAKNINNAEKELYELRVEYITTKSELMDKHKRSTIERAVKSVGLRSSIIAPLIIEKN